MTLSTTNDQGEIRACLAAAGFDADRGFTPAHGASSCIGMTRIDSQTWLVVERFTASGEFKATLIEDATAEEFAQVWREMNTGCSMSGQRVHFSEGSERATSAERN